MEQSFNSRTGVLYQHPRHPQNYKTVRKRWILVPMCEYKVSVPYPKPNELNLFQMTVLRLLVSGSKDDAYLASRLCLHKELVAFIVDELEKRRLIDKRRRVTESGLALVRTGMNAYEIKTGYVYYNYVTKTFMDAFVADDKHNEVETRGRREDTISFDIGTVADRNWQKGTIVNVDHSAVVTPNPYEVMAICKKHNRRRRSLGFMSAESDEVKSEAAVRAERRMSDGSELPQEIQSVKLLGTQKDVYVATYLFMAADDVINRSRLQVCYPFGEGTSSGLTEIIEKVARNPENAPLKNEILGLKNDVFGMSDQELEEIRRSHLASEKKIKNILSDNIDDYPVVKASLLAVETSHLLVRELLEANKGSNVEIIKKNLDDYINRNYELLVSILLYTAKSYDYFTDAQLTGHVEQNALLLKELAKKQGFTETDTRAADKFFRMKPRTIREAANTGQQLNALFAYNLIAADHFPEHPFYKLSDYVPELIAYLSKLRDLRNDSSHPNEFHQTFETVSSYRRKNMYIAFLLLRGLQYRMEENDLEEASESRENDVRAMREAELICERLYSEYFQRNTNIANQLRDLQYEILMKGNEYPKRASKVLEAIFRQALSKRCAANAAACVKDSSNPASRAELLKEMQQFGFDVERIPYHYTNRVLATFRDYTQGTLITLFYAWYYSEVHREDNMLGEVAHRCPELIKLIDEMHFNREHSGKMNFDSNDLDFTKKHIDNAVNTLLDVLFKHSAL